MAKATDDEPSRRGVGMHAPIQGRRRGDFSKDEHRVGRSGASSHDRLEILDGRVWSSPLPTSWCTSGLLTDVQWGYLRRSGADVCASVWLLTEIGCKVKSFWVPNFYSHNYGLIFLLHVVFPIKDVRRFINGMDLGSGHLEE